MPRRALTVQEAFLGARRARAETEAEERKPAPKKPAARRRAAPPKQPAGEAPPPADSPVLEEALAEVEAARGQLGPPERLTLYLPPDLSADLTRLWEELRERTGLKVGKSLLGMAALRLVLENEDLAAQMATEAVRAKLGR